MLTRYCGIEVTDAELGVDHMIIQSNKLHVVGSLHYRLLPRDCIQIQALNPRNSYNLGIGPVSLKWSSLVSFINYLDHENHFIQLEKHTEPLCNLLWVFTGYFIASF